MKRSHILIVLVVFLVACSAGPGSTFNDATATVEVVKQATQMAVPDTKTEPGVYPEPQENTTATIYPAPQMESTESAYPDPETVLTAYPNENSTPQVEGPVSPMTPAGFPDPSAYTWQSVVSGFNRPVDAAGDGSGRLLVVEQPGRILVIENGSLRTDPYLDITDRVGSTANEQGLLGLALHPKYLENGFFYVNYTNQSGNTVIARFAADPATGVARADSEKKLLQVKQPYSNHNGGGLAFGPDGFLYIGLGDGGSGGDPEGRGQNMNTLLGKLLRIDVDSGDPFAIPADNPFASGGGSKEIWASGLRNPWRFSFDALTGDLYIGDVGQNMWEEIDFLPAKSAGGTNFGWNYREGANTFEGEPPSGLKLVDPIFQYQHPEGCSVSGGFVYRGTAIPEIIGIYLFGDYCTGRIWGLFRASDGQWKNQMLFDSGLSPSSFGVDDQNELYLLDHGNGVLLKLVKK